MMMSYSNRIYESSVLRAPTPSRFSDLATTLIIHHTCTQGRPIKCQEISSNFSWHQISQKANEIFGKISALASKMGQIKKVKTLYYINYLPN